MASTQTSVEFKVRLCGGLKNLWVIKSMYLICLVNDLDLKSFLFRMAQLHYSYQNKLQMDSQVVTTLASFSLDLTKSRCGIPYIFPRKQVSQPFQSLQFIPMKITLAAWIFSYQSISVSHKFRRKWNFIRWQKIVTKYQ